MSAAEVLEAARDAGIHIEVDGADLVWRSSGPPPSDILDLLRAHKAEIIAEITMASIASQDADDAVVDWRNWYEQQAVIRQFDRRYTRDEAERLAQSEVEDRWHRANGERVPRDLCAGCRRPIGSAQALDLIDGNRVHFGDLNCLVRHGNRWRAVAAQALELIGIGKWAGREMASEALAVLPPSAERVAEYFRTRRGTLSELSAGDLEFNDRLWQKICGLSDGETDFAAQDASFFGAHGVPGVTIRPTDVLASDPRVTHQPALRDEPPQPPKPATPAFP